MVAVTFKGKTFKIYKENEIALAPLRVGVGVGPCPKKGMLWICHTNINAQKHPEKALNWTKSSLI